MEEAAAPSAGDGVDGVLARLAAPVGWEIACLDTDCPIGSLATDALRAWSTGDRKSDFLVGLLPSRWLGGGLIAGGLDWAAVARAVPAHDLVELRLPVNAIASLLEESMREAWASCRQPGGSWQVSGLEYERLCEGGTAHRGSRLRLVSRRNGSLVAPPADTPVSVVTLAPVLSLLPAPLATPAVLSTSAQRVVADYLRAHSPLNYSAGRPRLRTEGCGRSACDAPLLRALTAAISTVGGARADPSPRHAALAGGLHGFFLSPTLLVLLLLAALVGGALLRRRRGGRRWPEGGGGPAEQLPIKEAPATPRRPPSSQASWRTPEPFGYGTCRGADVGESALGLLDGRTGGMRLLDASQLAD